MKVKIISVIGNVINLSVDGVPYSYLISRPMPLTAKDMQVMLDRSFLNSMLQPLELRPWTSRLQTMFARFVSQCRKRETHVLSNLSTSMLAEWIRQNAIPLEVEGQECLVLTSSMLEKIERGELQ